MSTQKGHKAQKGTDMNFRDELDKAFKSGEMAQKMAELHWWVATYPDNDISGKWYEDSKTLTTLAIRAQYPNLDEDEISYVWDYLVDSSPYDQGVQEAVKYAIQRKADLKDEADMLLFERECVRWCTQCANGLKQHEDRNWYDYKNSDKCQDSGNQHIPNFPNKTEE
jgi:hypothetical protein